MVSVSSAVPKLPDGSIDIVQWSQRLVDVLLHVCSTNPWKRLPLGYQASVIRARRCKALSSPKWLPSCVSTRLLLAAMTYPGLRRSLFDEDGLSAAACWGSATRLCVSVANTRYFEPVRGIRYPRAGW